MRKERNSKCKKSGPWPLALDPVSHLMFSIRHLILNLDNWFGNQGYIAYFYIYKKKANCKISHPTTSCTIMQCKTPPSIPSMEFIYATLRVKCILTNSWGLVFNKCWNNAFPYCFWRNIFYTCSKMMIQNSCFALVAV